jgi:PAS domain S-box-containing protein
VTVNTLPVLVVEDDETTATLERLVLRRAGLDVQIVSRVEQAKSLLASRPFQAVVLDYQLPDGDSWAVLEAARAATPRVPVVLVTAMGNEEIVAEALRRGAADYVRKSATFANDLGKVVSRVAQLALTEERLRHSGALFQLLADNPADLIATFDAAGYVRYVSSACRPLLGYEVGELAGRQMAELIHPEDLPNTWFARNPAKPANGPARDLFRCRRRDDSYAWLESHMQPVFDSSSGAVVEVVSISRDVSERVIAQHKIEDALREKTVLLQEVHHRVRNNLQLITSLLTLQSAHAREPAVMAVLEESKGRVRAMTLAHQSLYDRTDFAQLSLGDYLYELAGSLSRTVGRDRPDVVCQVRRPETEINIGFDQAVPCGLLINELLTNAWKHAFPDQRRGRIDVRVSQTDNGHIAIAVADDGIGLPADFRLEDAASLGLQLARTLSDQLRAKLQRIAGAGTTFEIDFPLQGEYKLRPKL